MKLRPKKKPDSRVDVVVGKGLAGGSDQQLAERDQQLDKERDPENTGMLTTTMMSTGRHKKRS